jgi:hypothetical protein
MIPEWPRVSSETIDCVIDQKNDCYWLRMSFVESPYSVMLDAVISDIWLQRARRSPVLISVVAFCEN